MVIRVAADRQVDCNPLTYRGLWCRELLVLEMQAAHGSTMTVQAVAVAGALTDHLVPPRRVERVERDCLGLMARRVREEGGDRVIRLRALGDQEAVEPHQGQALPELQARQIRAVAVVETLEVHWEAQAVPAS